MMCSSFFFNATATTEIYTLSLHDALPILMKETDEAGSEEEDEDDDLELQPRKEKPVDLQQLRVQLPDGMKWEDRKSTRLNSSHSQISYAVFCLKKKKTKKKKNRIIKSN